MNNPCGATVLEAAHENGLLNLPDALLGLRDLGITSMMVEGGAHTIAGFFRSGKVQRLHSYQAPVVFGGANAIGWSARFGGTAMADRIRLERVRRVGIGRDLYQTGRVRFP